MGVMVAYITVIALTSSLLISVKKKYLLPKKDALSRWPGNLSHINRFTQRNSKAILLGSLFFIVCCSVGVAKINTNYQFKESLPKGSPLAIDFQFFQENYTGFRPLEIAILAKKGHKVTDLVVAKEIEKIEDLIIANRSIGNVQSVNTFSKVINKAHHLNKQEFYVIPKDEKTYKKYQIEAKRLARRQLARYVDSSETKGRITATVLDVGADSLLRIYDEFNSFIISKIDTSLVNFKLTGKGLLLDKNSMYVRQSLLEGLVIASIIVGLLMVVLFKNIKLLIISLIPNLLSLLFAGALLGFLDIPLEASISIVFAIVFGIAVDDTIHFLSRFKQCRASGLDQEESLEKTFQETGKALVITTIVLFFGFMVMLFSIHQPSVTVGLLISFTLLVALVLDLLLLPVIIRKLL
jgi:predicted RND superfamily exporter protein